MANEDDEFTKFWGEPISVYTSEQAEADGVLVKVDHPQINYITHSVMETCIMPSVKDGLTEQEKAALIKELIARLLKSVVAEVIKINKRDWFYAVEVNGCKFFVAQNETGKYTVMLQEDY